MPTYRSREDINIDDNFSESCLYNSKDTQMYLMTHVLTALLF